jgi:hypothetical protein
MTLHRPTRASRWTSGDDIKLETAISELSTSDKDRIRNHIRDHVGDLLKDHIREHPSPGSPRIQAAGNVVPEIHADRVVAEMLRWIVAERQQRMTALRGILGSTPDANPQDQQRLADKLQRLGGGFFSLVTLTKSGKRGRYEIKILALDGWNRDTRKLIFVRDEIPQRPQLAASVLTVKGLGHHQHDIEMNVELIVSHHALSRLVQRSENRTVDDLLTAVKSMFVAFVIAGIRIADGENGQNSRLRFRTNGGEVIAQLERHWDGSGKVVAKTILEITDD